MNIENFISKNQYQVLMDLINISGEAEQFKEKLAEIKTTI